MPVLKKPPIIWPEKKGILFPIFNLILFLCVVAQGRGTAIEGWVMIPKPGGVRKGWRPMWLTVSDGMLIFYECQASKKVFFFG